MNVNETLNALSTPIPANITMAGIDIPTNSETVIPLARINQIGNREDRFRIENNTIQIVNPGTIKSVMMDFVITLENTVNEDIAVYFRVYTIKDGNNSASNGYQEFLQQEYVHGVEPIFVTKTMFDLSSNVTGFYFTYIVLENTGTVDVRDGGGHVYLTPYTNL